MRYPQLKKWRAALRAIATEEMARRNARDWSCHTFTLQHTHAMRRRCIMASDSAMHCCNDRTQTYVQFARLPTHKLQCASLCNGADCQQRRVLAGWRHASPTQGLRHRHVWDARR
jgi:hypothetical protein